MKTSVIHVLLVALISMGSYHAQEVRSPRPRVIATPSRPDTPSNDASKVLSRNYTVTVAGSLGQGQVMDVVMHGSSSKFSADLSNPNRRIEILVAEDGDTLWVTYSVGARLRVEGANGSAQYEDVSVRGTFRATPGEAFPVLEVGTSKLTIQVGPVAD